MTQQELFEIELSHIDGETKTCSKCERRLPLSSFSVSSGANFLRPECKKCNNDLTKVRNRLRYKYGMPDSNYQCPICKKDETEVAGKGGQRNGAWVIDHCHESETFRGWLCHSCNRSLGGFFDSVEFLKRAIIYLENHKETLNEINN